jgi:hypothetical protein
MPPWPEWQLEYIGTRYLGKLLALWTAFWITVFRKIFRLIFNGRRNSRSLPEHSRNQSLSDVHLRSEHSIAKRLYKMAISTLLTLGVWRIATLNSLWLATNASVHRFIAAVLLLVSAGWVISLIWIVLSKRQPRRIATEHSYVPPFDRSNHAKVR